MPEEARKKRYEWLDVLKFMGMLEIYIAHMGTVSGKLLPLMFVFNVQLFFFMSGLFYRPPQKGQLRGYLVDKVCGILVPYFLFSFIIMGLSFIRHDFELSKFKDYANFIFIGHRNATAGSALWFLNCYFVVVVLYTLVMVLVRNKYLALLVSFALFEVQYPLLGLLHLNSEAVIFNFDSAIGYLVFFSIGHCFADLFKREWDFKTAQGKGVILLRAAALAMLALVYFKGDTYLTEKLPVLEFARIGEFLQILLLIEANVFLAKCLTWVPYIQQLGRDSLILCGCEDSTRVLVNDFISIFGLPIIIQTPLASVLCALLYLVVCSKIYGTLARRYFPILAGKWRPGQPVLQRKTDTAHRFTEI